ncbi:MAG TPA: leucyl aminopeptidase [Xanthobacteraceae bacterium]|nr:leucyl aminopeptidase [Xanthobacteraceae bacterium]
MSGTPKISFSEPKPATGGTLVVLVDEDLRSGRLTRRALQPAGDLISRAARAEGFKGKKGKTLDVIAPAGLKAERLLVLGLGKLKEIKPADWAKLGGGVMGKLSARAKNVTVLFEFPDGAAPPEAAADFAFGMRLRGYRFDRYKTKQKNGDDKEQPSAVNVTIAVADAPAARKKWNSREAIAGGVELARDLVNEPPNVLFPVEFARRASALKKLGVAVEILDVARMKKLGMGALLGVGQGSVHEPRLVVMRWNGGKKSDKPVAIVGKGVCFDTGGISIKPAGGMEDMKGDMAGAACVVGLMHALAAREARANVVGVIGLVENMPDGAAQRPGDIVKSMSGQTIEIINTDAEGRLVLADALWYTKERFAPKFMIDLATLTGAILISLGQEYGGLFCNDDKLAEHLIEAGSETGERVWRLPLGPEYDKLIDSKFADMKNTGGRNAGSITAAQFLQRFVDKTPWAHLDIAGTGMGAPASDINTSWGPGWGVRLLDRLVRNRHEG